jgi:hypothetical protein
MFQNLYAKGYAYTGCHIMQYSIFYILFFKVNTCTNLSLWENGHTKSWLCLHYYFLWIQYAFPWPKLFSIHQVDTLWSFLYTTFNDGNAAVSKIFLKNMQVHICWYARTNILTPVPSNIFLLYCNCDCDFKFVIRSHYSHSICDCDCKSIANAVANSQIKLTKIANFSTEFQHLWTDFEDFTVCFSYP